MESEGALVTFDCNLIIVVYTSNICISEGSLGNLEVHSRCAFVRPRGQYGLGFARQSLSDAPPAVTATHTSPESTALRHARQAARTHPGASSPAPLPLCLPVIETSGGSRMGEGGGQALNSELGWGRTSWTPGKRRSRQGNEARWTENLSARKDAPRRVPRGRPELTWAGAQVDTPPTPRQLAFLCTGSGWVGLPKAGVTSSLWSLGGRRRIPFSL